MGREVHQKVKIWGRLCRLDETLLGRLMQADEWPHVKNSCGKGDWYGQCHLGEKWGKGLERHEMGGSEETLRSWWRSAGFMHSHGWAMAGSGARRGRMLKTWIRWLCGVAQMSQPLKSFQRDCEQIRWLSDPFGRHFHVDFGHWTSVAIGQKLCGHGWSVKEGLNT